MPAELGRDPAFDCPGILNDPPGIVPGNPELGRPLLEPAMLVSWLLAVGGADVKPGNPRIHTVGVNQRIGRSQAQESMHGNKHHPRQAFA